LSCSLSAADIGEDLYGDFSDFLSGIDPNAGLTAFPVLNVPMGGRSEGMAGAFTAVADDISFIEYNPAGSSMLSLSELAFFHNNWIADTNVEGVVYATRSGDLGLAAGGKWLYLPFTEYNIYGERASKGYYSEAVGMLNISYNFLSRYYFSGVSAGMNIKGAFRFVPDYSNDQGHIISGSGLSQSAAQVMADLGLLTRFDLFKFYTARERNSSAALVIRNVGLPAKGDPLPTVATAGFSYKPIRPLLFSFDFSYPINLQNPGLSEKPYWAAGISAALTPFLSMRTGALIKTGNIRCTLGSAITLDKVTLDINYTVDLLTQLQPFNRLSIGVRINLGDGGRSALSDEVDRLYLAGLDAYAKGKREEATHYWEEALRLNPKFDPAKEGLSVIARTQALEDRINELQQLEF
jgi:tetratricopeptide (TPR) repeat protein